MNFTEEQLESNLYHLIFSRHLSNPEIVSKYNLDEDEEKKLYDRYQPYTVYTFSDDELKSFLLCKKEIFIDENSFFDFEDFYKDELDFLEFELNDFLEKTFTHRDCINGTYFIDSNDSDRRKTLFLTDKNHKQLRFYFKNILKIIAEAEELLDKPTKENTTNKKVAKTTDNLGFNAFNYTKDAEKLYRFRESLINEGLINSGTKQKDFDNAFCNQPVVNRVDLTGNRNKLYYLFKYLKDKKFIKEKNYWNKVPHLFLLNGEEIKDKIKISKANRLDDADETARIESIVNKL